MNESTKTTEEFRFGGEEVVAKIKELWRAGNIRHLVLKTKEDKKVFSLTLTIATIVTILLPQLVLIATIIALVLHCSIVIEKE